MEPNYENMPKGATHYGKVNDFFTPWYKLDGTQWLYCFTTEDRDSEFWTPCSNNKPYHQPTTEIKSAQRDENQSGVPDEKEWIPGKTLPPVGTIVEIAMDLPKDNFYNSKPNSGDHVEIIAHMKVYDTDDEPSVAIFRVRDDSYTNGFHTVRQAIPACFRAKRTAEQIEEDKMNDDLDILQEELSIDGNSTEIALLQQLYKAGKLLL